MTTDKSLGQIAFESYMRVSGDIANWEKQPREYWERWDEAASAVAAEVRRRDAADDKAHSDWFERPEQPLTKYETVALEIYKAMAASDARAVEAKVAFDFADAFMAEASKRRNKC